MRKQCKVLVITGGYISGLEKSFLDIFIRQLKQFVFSRHFWFEMIIKLIALEPIMRVNLILNKKKNKVLKNKIINFKEKWTPELTEVILATLLKKFNYSFELTSVDELFSNKDKKKKFLNECQVIFISTTFLRDFSELKPLLSLFGSQHKIVIGGPMTQLYDQDWADLKEVNLVVKGSGEFAMELIDHWIENDFKITKNFSNIDISKTNHLYMANIIPPDNNYLDYLESPDWSVVENYYGKKFETVHYESVRGCPYRCGFCNYPYLFNDNRFRYKSATKIADEWLAMNKKNPDLVIRCLDSLFTMPKRRLIELCEILIENNFTGKWICYARAEDLVDIDVCRLMQNAGAIEIQIGIESGSQDILLNMNKGVNLSQNIQAIKNCRAIGLTSVVSIVVGFPGETKDSVEDTLNLFRHAKPDFYFLAALNTRVKNVPMLNEANRVKFNFWTNDDTSYTSAPYWKHYTMGCDEVGEWVLYLNKKIGQERLALNAFAFYPFMHLYQQSMREDLLTVQEESLKIKFLRKIFVAIIRMVNKLIRRDIKKINIPAYT
jgi:anaerobic magnesium-protoporphyrin IX monomethyl ester cyclase